jgi:Sulfotransferase family
MKPPTIRCEDSVMTGSTVRKIAKSAAQYLADARTDTGIDIVDEDIRESLERLLVSLDTEAKLSANGLIGFELWLPRILRNRLRIFRDLRDHPEILEQKIERPLFLTGGGRTGSTKLHKLIGAGGDFKVLHCWQGISAGLVSENRIEDPTPRVREADAWVRWFNESAPKAKLTHEFSTLEIEEENLIFELMLFAPYIGPWFHVPGYIEWYMPTMDMRRELAFLKPVIQYLQWQFHDGDPRPWILKSPIYPGFEPMIREVFPDAVCVTTLRDPVQVVSSGISLNKYYHVAYSDADLTEVLGAAMMDGLAYSLDNYMASRAAHPDIDVLEIGYKDTTKRVEQVVERIYAHYGMPLANASRERMRAWDSANRQHPHGVHAHSLEGTGVTEESIRERFKTYMSRYAAYL